MSRIFDYPPILTGSERDQLRQLYSYLYQLMDQLTVQLENIEIGTGAGTTTTVQTAEASAVAAELDKFRRSLTQVGAQAEKAQKKADENAEKIEAAIDIIGDMMLLVEELTGEIDSVVDGLLEHEERIRAIERLFVKPLGAFVLGTDKLA